MQEKSNIFYSENLSNGRLKKYQKSSEKRAPLKQWPRELANAMKEFLYSTHFDLITPDGFLETFHILNSKEAMGDVLIENISQSFAGFQIFPIHLQFNLKSTLAQLGLNAVGKDYFLDKERAIARIKVHISALSTLGEQVLSLLNLGTYIGKLFAADERRRVRDPKYLTRMFHRFDREGRPLLLFGEKNPEKALHLEKIDNRLVAFIELKKGKILYDKYVEGIFPALASALKKNDPCRNFLHFHQIWEEDERKSAVQDEFILVKTAPLHIRTVFARVISSLLPKGLFHTTANILEPNTHASGDIYELYGQSEQKITHIPLEFFTLEPEREYVFFSDRDQLQHTLENPKKIFDFFKSAPHPLQKKAAIFVVKGTQMERVKSSDWIVRSPVVPNFAATQDSKTLATLIESYIEDQPCYPFLQAINDGKITSQGVMFTRYLCTPLMKSMLLSFNVISLVKRIYFQYPSQSSGNYFSQEDRAFLLDLTFFGIPVYWVDEISGTLLRYVQRHGKKSGMFVPQSQVDTFRNATFFGIYGSNLLQGNFENELKNMLGGIIKMRERINHPLLNKSVPLALMTGGGPGAMEVGNRMARELDILSCAHIVDFQVNKSEIVHEQRQNPYVEAKMTYRLDQLIERQAVFYLDFPIFVIGGIGTDFEFSLEELRYKVSARPLAPIILFGKPEYWRDKITTRFQCNLKSGTIKGSEWLSNCLFCIQNAQQGLRIFEDFFTGKLPLGENFPIYEEGFVIVD